MSLKINKYSLNKANYYQGLMTLSAKRLFSGRIDVLNVKFSSEK